MRDLLITGIVFGSLPFILKRPYIGILMWVWISVMNPHRLAYGFAYTFPFAEVIALTTLLSTLFSRDRRFPVVPATVFLILFMIWMNITSLFAIHFDQIYFHWATIMKILLMTLVSIAVIHTKEQVRLFIWVLVLSLGFYGVKGGIFTLASGGNFHVWGPEGSFIEDNNSLALALIMVIPLMRYLQLTEPSAWIRRGLTVAMLLCGFSALGSYSRGALIAIGATAVFLWLKSSRKLAIGIGLIATITLLVTFMPAKWEERMHTIDTYQQDASAMGRINAWHMAWNLAMDRPIVGGGFEIYDKEVFAKYAPDPLDVHAAHSIYFQILGEHGFVGLILFLTLGVITWRNGSWIIARTRDRPDLLWASNLAKMLQVSQIAYATGGAFLSLAYFDMPYYVLAAMVVTKILVERALSTEQPAAIPASRKIIKRRLVFSGSASLNMDKARRLP
ncbi:MAG: putative O-glycosylation ligase, exosortase A system-associated [Burkholderiales bacterium]